MACKENSTETPKGQQQQRQKFAAYHGFRDLWKLIFQVYMCYFIFLRPTRCQERKKKSFFKLITEKKYTQDCHILALVLEAEKKKSIHETDKSLHIGSDMHGTCC